MQDTRPLISAIVCTRDRPDSVRTALESLSSQDYPRYEVLVVDQSRSTATGVLLETCCRVDDRFRYLHLDEPGLSRAYNAGIRSTRGQLLAFTDDDCAAPEDWLASIERAFTRHPQVDLIYGQVLIPFALLAQEGKVGFTPALPIPRRRLVGAHHGFEVFGMGANFAARRRLFECVGLFDEVLGGGGPLQSSQDFDFTYRAFRAGCVTLLEPEVVVHHYGFRSSQDWPATVGGYGVGVGGFYLKHVRSGDLYAARLLLGHLAYWSARSLRRWLTRGRSRSEWSYVRNLIRGMRRSFDFEVDSERRLYRLPGTALKESG